jgi:hypothetical protein
MRLLSFLLFPLLLVACAAGTGYRYPVGPTPLPVLSTVTLHQPIQIRAERASEYIQDSEVRPYNTISEYYPHCIFELRTVADTTRTVSPETFMVTGIRRDRFMAGFRRLMVADNGGGDYNPVMSTTVISLHSDRQPDVFRLSCKQLDEPYLARHVSLEQMRKTLGDLLTLE